MKFGHEEVQSLGVLLSLAVASASLYMSVTDRLALKENILVTARMSDLQYKTRVRRDATGYFTFDARFRLLIANNSNRAVSISEIVGGYTYNDAASHGAVIGPVNKVDAKQGAVFEPINLGAWQSQSIEVVVRFPINEECQFKDLPVDRETDAGALINLFSKNNRTFPVCAPIRWSEDQSTSAIGATTPSRFSGPIFSVSSSTGNVVHSAVWVYDSYNPGPIKSGR